jgi:hypothetical protein
VVVRNVAFEATRKDLLGLFGPFGHIKSCRCGGRTHNNEGWTHNNEGGHTITRGGHTITRGGHIITRVDTQ